MSNEELFWHCWKCAAHEPVDPNGDGCAHGDEEKCTTCTDDSPGMARVMTQREAAWLESKIALGVPPRDAYARLVAAIAEQGRAPAGGGK